METAITAAIIARDEAQHLGPCLRSVAWATERLVVLDQRTTDDSAVVAAAHGARVVERPFTTFPSQRNAALELVRTPWVLFIDADERVTPSLAREILERLADASVAAPVGYWIPRRNLIWGGWIRHGGWYPDYQLRLLRVGRARYDEQRDVHELVQIDGPTGVLSECLIHYNYATLAQFMRKQRQYSSLEAERLARADGRLRPHSLVLQPLREFRRRLITLAGYRDGWRGILLASLLSWFTFETEIGRIRRVRSRAIASDHPG